MEITENNSVQNSSRAFLFSIKKKNKKKIYFPLLWSAICEIYSMCLQFVFSVCLQNIFNYAYVTNVCCFILLLNVQLFKYLALTSQKIYIYMRRVLPAITLLLEPILMDRIQYQRELLNHPLQMYITYFMAITLS